MYTSRKNVFVWALALMVLGMIMGYSYTLITGMFQEDERLANEKAQMNGADTLANSLESLAAVKQPQYTSQETTFIFEKMYKQCGHNSIHYRPANAEEAGLSRAQIQAVYPSRVIKEFSPSIVWLYEEIDGYCPNHYIIKENDGCIAIYRPLENGEGIYLVHQTQISTAFLDTDIRERIRNGLRVDSLEQVEQLMESWDS